MIFSTKQGMLDMQFLCTFIEQSLYLVGCWHKQESYSSEFKSIRRKYYTLTAYFPIVFCQKYSAIFSYILY